MEEPPLSLRQLGIVLSEAPSHEALYDSLSQYEDEACLQFTHAQILGDEKLLSAYYSSFLISHLLTNQIQEARALTKRMPPTLLKSDEVLRYSIAILRAVWQNQYHEIYHLLRNQTWPEPVNVIANKFDAFFTEKTFKDVSRVYESIRPEAAAEYLGLEELVQNGAGSEPSAELIQTLVQRGWEWDDEKRLFQPHYPEESLKVGGLNTRLHGINRIAGLAGNHGS
ncbi:putative COP9 signalosome subunit 8 [Talaromyces proteolyticus]|uniref:COP9 signalosome subunit 8 n=1 Tax=Talaromyces proteolyticus TaxID=1131652 RepID=A0AAD4Q352_9EURO|nr:putative COP9 signalosome subunit 8 [Talaromyces proteolyticus]KAH8701077.1 putative COP9 signalosome subunit 8 [Talaromyces proteolyticus]